MSCRLNARQCISATVAGNNEAVGVKLDATFVSIVFHRPRCRAYCHTRLSAHPVCDCRQPLPVLANLLGLHGRGDCAARALGGGRDGRCPVLPLPPLGHRRVRSGARNLAERCAVVAPLDLCRARRRGKGPGIGLSHRSRVQEGQRHGASIRDIEASDCARHVEAHQEIAVFPAEAPQPFPFAAKHERDRPPQGDRCQT
jgi:hypothetical protein